MSNYKSYTRYSNNKEAEDMDPDSIPITGKHHLVTSRSPLCDVIRDLVMDCR
jgi:hypothetical protein